MDLTLPFGAAGAPAVATLDDIAALNVLVNGAYRGEASRIGWTTEADFLDGQRIDELGLRELIVAEGSAVLVIREAQSILGCCHVSRIRADRAYIGMVSIEPSRQRHGLGGQLLLAAEHYVQSVFQARRLRMTVISLRAELIAWYESRGYQPTGERQPFPNDEPRFGIPKRRDLEFVVLEKTI